MFRFWFHLIFFCSRLLISGQCFNILIRIHFHNCIVHIFCFNFHFLSSFFLNSSLISIEHFSFNDLHAQVLQNINTIYIFNVVHLATFFALLSFYTIKFLKHTLFWNQMGLGVPNLLPKYQTGSYILTMGEGSSVYPFLQDIKTFWLRGSHILTRGIMGPSTSSKISKTFWQRGTLISKIGKHGFTSSLLRYVNLF